MLVFYTLVNFLDFQIASFIPLWSEKVAVTLNLFNFEKFFFGRPSMVCPGECPLCRADALACDAAHIFHVLTDLLGILFTTNTFLLTLSIISKYQMVWFCWDLIVPWL